MVRIMTIEDYEGVYARRQVSWQKKTVALSEVFCAVTTEDGGVCIMSV